VRIALALWIAVLLLASGVFHPVHLARRGSTAGIVSEQLECRPLSLEMRLENPDDNGSEGLTGLLFGARMNADVFATASPFALHIVMSLRVRSRSALSLREAALRPNAKGPPLGESLCVG
jgi:hypothetical protein